MAIDDMDTDLALPDNCTIDELAVYFDQHFIDYSWEFRELIQLFLEFCNDYFKYGLGPDGAPRVRAFLQVLRSELICRNTDIHVYLNLDFFHKFVVNNRKKADLAISNHNLEFRINGMDLSIGPIKRKRDELEVPSEQEEKAKAANTKYNWCDDVPAPQLTPENSSQIQTNSAPNNEGQSIVQNSKTNTLANTEQNPDPNTHTRNKKFFIYFEMVKDWRDYFREISRGFPSVKSTFTLN